MLDNDSGRRLWWTKNRERYFFIPHGHELVPGENALLTAGRRPQKADLSALATFEIPREDANAWIGQRVRTGFASAGAAWDRLIKTAAQSTNTDVPPQKTTVDPESVLGMSPEALADDPARAREAVQNALRWASTRLNNGQTSPRPAAPDLAQKLPALAGALQKLGQSIQQAGKRMEEHAAPKSLRRVGFFRELRHSGGHGPSLHAARGDTPPPHAARILAYLDAGHTLIASPGVTRDVLSHSNEAPISGTATVLTDGVWAWPQDLRYYLDAHNVRLPADFLAHMLAADFSVPPDVALDRLVLPSGEA